MGLSHATRNRHGRNRLAISKDEAVEEQKPASRTSAGFRWRWRAAEQPLQPRLVALLDLVLQPAVTSLPAAQRFPQAASPSLGLRDPLPLGLAGPPTRVRGLLPLLQGRGRHRRLAPPAFFAWSFSYDAMRDPFSRRAQIIATSGGFISIGIAVFISLPRAPAGAQGRRHPHPWFRALGQAR
jgi:hypothetical protein